MTLQPGQDVSLTERTGQIEGFAHQLELLARTAGLSSLLTPDNEFQLALQELNQHIRVSVPEWDTKVETYCDRLAEFVKNSKSQNFAAASQFSEGMRVWSDSIGTATVRALHWNKDQKAITVVLDADVGSTKERLAETLLRIHKSIDDDPDVYEIDRQLCVEIRKRLQDYSTESEAPDATEVTAGLAQNLKTTFHWELPERLYQEILNYDPDLSREGFVELAQDQLVPLLTGSLTKRFGNPTKNALLESRQLVIDSAIPEEQFFSEMFDQFTGTTAGKELLVECFQKATQARQEEFFERKRAQDEDDL